MMTDKRLDEIALMALVYPIGHEVKQLVDEIKQLRSENKELRKWLEGSKLIIANMQTKENEK